MPPLISLLFLLISITFGSHIDQTRFTLKQQADDSIWKFCSNDNIDSYTFKVSSVEIEPSTPVVGKDLTVKIVGYNNNEISGGNIHAELKAGPFTIQHDFELCSALGSYSNTQCPVSQGNQTIEVKANIPKGIPAIKIQGQVIAKDQDQRTIACIELNFKLIKQ